MKRTYFLFAALLLVILSASSRAQQLQKGMIEGRIFNAKNNEPVPFANIVIWGTSIGSTSDLDGKFIFTGLEPGYVELRVSSVGFETYTTEQMLITNANKMYVDIAMEETKVALDAVVVKASPFRKTEESPVSLRRIGIEEIERNPGGNRDISKVIQSFPGVASTPAYRNDVIVRGGGPSENRYYIDGVEIPNINHFATQGASGGPVGIINVDFIREVNFYSGAFPANRGNALSSVLEFSQVDGNRDKLKFRGSVGASDLAITFDGPLNEKTTYIASVRRSYLQLLFAALELPFLPTYNDFQFKVRSRLSDKTELTLVGLGAIDLFDLNLNANKTESQRYILSYLPVNEQWNYTTGAVLKHFGERSYDTWVLSRNFLNNSSYKFKNNIEEDSLKTLDYKSTEGEIKFRYENTARFGNDLKTNLGVNLEYGQYTNNTFQKIYAYNQPIDIRYESDLNIIKWGLFGQASREFMDGLLVLSLGARADANSYSDEMSNMLRQISPRFSASYSLTPKLFLNFNTGRFYQQPAYTTMGYRDQNGVLVNKANGLRYISSDQLVLGFEILPEENSKITLEGFYKYYRNYPVSIRDSIALASKGADYGTFGDEEVKSLADGRAYGLEFLYRSRDLFGNNLVLSYTLVRSEFQDMKNNWIVSAWDNRHIFNLTLTRDFKKGWNLGAKWRYVGGAPTTPWDLDKSSLQSAWDASGRAYLDYSRFNQERLDGFHQLDIRIDKEFFFRNWSLITYLDIQNLYNFKAEETDRIVRTEDANGNYLPASGNPPKYPLTVIPSEGSGTVLPTIGIIIQF
jgi:hypothetical protein